MNLLVPAALGLASLALPLVVLYMLRSRRRQREVPSTLLWEKTGETVTAAVPWKPLEVGALLLLQLAVLALFVLSLARPFFTQATLLGPHTVLVIDTSGSMAMGGRLERAQTRAVELVADASQANQVSVVEAGPSARVVAAFVRTPEAARQAIQSLEPTGGAADLSGAVRLARGLATPDRPTNLVVLSDGGPAPLPEEPLSAAIHVPFDETADNLAIAAFSAEPSTEGTVRAFLSVANHTTRSHTASVELAVNDLPTGVVELEVAPRSSSDRVVPLPAGPGDVVVARLAGGPDGLPLDDTAWLVLGSGPERPVEREGSPSPFIEAVLAATPGFRAAGEDEAGEILVVEGGDLPEIDRPAWLMRTTQPPPGIELVELVENALVTHQRPGEPILDGVDLSGLAVAQAQVTETVSWLPLVRAGDVPLILLGEVNGHRTVYFTFDISHSNLPVQVGFPILASRLLEWLSGGALGAISTGVAGDPIPLQPPAGASTEVEMPDGSVRDLGSSAAAFTDTGTPGLYGVGYRMDDGTIRPGPIAVRSFDPSESAPGARQIATTEAPGGAREESTLVREWAPWIVAAALGLMGLEWWVAHRRSPGWRPAT